MARRVVITGATSGLGRAAATSMLEGGAQVVVSSENAGALAETLESLGGESDHLTGTVADVTDLAQVTALARHAQQRFAGFDCWINNAGTTAPSGPGAEVPVNYGERLIATNILGTYYGSITAVRHFRQSGGGSLINLTGRGEKGPVAGAALYASSKSWVRTFTLTLAKEERQRGIEIGLFNPGLTLTGLTARPLVLRGQEEKQVKGLRTVMPIIGNPAEEPAASLAALALGEQPIKHEMRHSRLLPRVLGRLLTGRRAQIDLSNIAPVIVEPELARELVPVLEHPDA